MGYTTPGKFSLGVDTSAASLKKDVKKNLAKKGGLGVDTSIKHDTSKSASAVKKAINAPATKSSSDGFAEFEAEVNALNPTSKVHTANGGKQIKTMPWGAQDDRNDPTSGPTGPLMPPNTSGSEAFDKGNWATDRFAGTNARQNTDMKSNYKN